MPYHNRTVNLRQLRNEALEARYSGGYRIAPELLIKLLDELEQYRKDERERTEQPADYSPQP